MPELTKEEKLKLVEKLPQRLQDFLYSEDTGAFLLYLGEKYNLADEKVSALSKIVGDIILKITPITSLAQEIANKVIPDSQTAMAIAQELNNELLTPTLMPAPAAPAVPPAAVMPSAPTPMPSIGKAPQVPSAAGGELGQTDHYRESLTGPEIVDLRAQPRPASPRVETPPAPAMPAPLAPATIPPKPMPPLTFTKPVEKVPLIEAEPHKTETPAPPQSGVSPRPQFIVRPPGLSPTDLPRDVLDLRKDKGEF